MELISLTVEEVIRLNQIVIRETTGSFSILNRHNIENCLEIISQIIFDKELHIGLFRKAAVLMHCISLSHGFLDGNKRTALLILAEFLNRNGFIFQPDEHVIRISLQTAMDKIDICELENWIFRCSKPKF